MSWESKVVWNEGLFLQPHHFQQHDRYVEALVSGVAGGVAPFAWGLSELEIDEELLKLGKVSVKSCAGLTPDGAPFRVPQVDDHPEALDAPETCKNTVVYLAIPTRRHGATEVDMKGNVAASRFTANEVEVVDTMGPDRRPVTVTIGKMRLSFALDLDDLSDQLVIPIARIIEVRSDKQVVLDNSFIPTCLDHRVSRTLDGFMRELEGLLSHRSEALAGRLAQQNATRGVAEIADFLLLIAVNRALPQVRHLSSIENAHPCMLYQFLTGLAGEMASFMTTEKRPPEFPLYQHHDLTGCFQPVMRALRQYLSAVLETNAVQIPLEPRKYGVHVALISDKRLLQTATFVLAAKAEVPPESVRRHFPGQVKLGPVEQIRQLVNSALPGVGLRALPVAPRQIPFNSGVVYFELDRDNQYFKALMNSGGLAVHVAGDFPGLEMQLWAIRQG